MTAAYFHYTVGKNFRILATQLNQFGLVVYGESMAKISIAARAAVQNGALPPGATIASEPLFFNPLGLSATGAEPVNWDLIYDRTMRLRGDPWKCRVQKNIVEIQPDQEGPGAVDLALGLRQLETLVGPDLAARMTAQGEANFFIASRYGSLPDSRLGPLSIVLAESMDEAAVIYLETVEQNVKQKIMVEPCCDILRA